MPGRTDDVGVVQRSRVARLKEEIRAEQDAVTLLEEQAGVPAMRHMRRRQKAQAVSADREGLAVVQRSRRTGSEIVDRDVRADVAAQRLGARSDREPIVQRSALVRLVWLKPIQRRRDGSINDATASRVIGNIFRIPVCIRKGSSSRIRNWLN